VLRIREAVVAEGKFDRQRLLEAVDAPVFVTNGFRIFKDREQLALLRRVAAERGVVILTDSDAAGFLIRDHLSGVLPPHRIKQAYIPRIPGKERRKAAPSREGMLGVEGMDPSLLEQALRRAGVTLLQESGPAPEPWMTKARLYADGLSGGPGSAERRRKLLAALDLPPYLSANRLVEALGLICTPEEYEDLLQNV